MSNKKSGISTHRKTTTEFSFILLPSSIHGIGVFSTHPIKKGARLRLFPHEKSRLVKKFSAGSLHDFHHYCIKTAVGWYCPSDFGAMAIGWYLNHSTKPNIYQKNYVYFAKRDIQPHEELTVNYKTLEPDWEPQSSSEKKYGTARRTR